MIAARHLAGFKQIDLDKRFQADKLSMITGKLERGESEIGDSYIRSVEKALDDVGYQPNRCRNPSARAHNLAPSTAIATSSARASSPASPGRSR